MLYFRTHAQHADTGAGSTNDEKKRDKRRATSNQFRLIISNFFYFSENKCHKNENKCHENEIYATRSYSQDWT